MRKALIIEEKSLSYTPEEINHTQPRFEGASRRSAIERTGAAQSWLAVVCGAEKRINPDSRRDTPAGGRAPEPR
jgi:hypothetical protein